MQYQVTINADWSRNIIININAGNKEQARKIAEKEKNNYGEPGIESIVCHIKKKGDVRNEIN